MHCEGSARRGQSISPGVPALTSIVRVASMTRNRSALARPPTMAKPAGSCAVATSEMKSTERPAGSPTATSVVSRSLLDAIHDATPSNASIASSESQNRRVKIWRTGRA